VSQLVAAEAVGFGCGEGVGAVAFFFASAISSFRRTNPSWSEQRLW
jgi:hypothetical protein